MHWAKPILFPQPVLSAAGDPIHPPTHSPFLFISTSWGRVSSFLCCCSLLLPLLLSLSCFTPCFRAIGSGCWWGGKRLGWSCWELCVCARVCVRAGKWANKGRWSMKGLEQRHSQLPNAWTRPQGPRTHTLSLTYSHTHTHAYTSFTYTWRGGSGGHNWELCACVWVGVHMRVMESGDLLNCCHFWQICATQVERVRLHCFPVFPLIF